MRELKSDHQIVRRSTTGLVGADEGLAQFGQIFFVLLDDDKLVRVRPPVRAHRHGFTAVNQLRAALAEPLPAPADFVGRAAGGSAVPAFHWLNGPAIADAFAVDGDVPDWLRQGRGAARDDLIL